MGVMASGGLVGVLSEFLRIPLQGKCRLSRFH
jgi:hypothetical protein